MTDHYSYICFSVLLLMLHVVFIWRLFFLCSHVFIGRPYCNCLRGYWLNKSNNLVFSERNIIGRFFLLFSVTNYRFSSMTMSLLRVTEQVTSGTSDTWINRRSRTCCSPDWNWTPQVSQHWNCHTLKTMYIVRQALERNWCKYNCRRWISWKNHDFYNNQPRIKLFIGITRVSCSIFACLTTGISNYKVFLFSFKNDYL